MTNLSLDSLVELRDLQQIDDDINAKLKESLLSVCPPSPTDSEILMVPRELLSMILQERGRLLGQFSTHEEKKEKKKAKGWKRKKSLGENKVSGNVTPRGAAPSSDPQKSPVSRTPDRSFSIESSIERRYSMRAPHIVNVLTSNPEFLMSSDLDLLPRTKITSLTTTRVLINLKGPGESSAIDQSYGMFASCKTTSTFPALPGRPTREGDPICDRFDAHLFENRVIASIADGQRNSENSRKAAKRATKYFAQFIIQSAKEITSVKACGSVLAAALAHAHLQIIDHGNADLGFYLPGNTSFLGGVLLEVDPNAASTDRVTTKSAPWIFAFISVGNCKCFRYDAKQHTISDHTVQESDPTPLMVDGSNIGRIGGSVKADLRDLTIRHIPVNEGDIIFLITPGVYENADPAFQGKLPSDFNLLPKTAVHNHWDTVDPSTVSEFKQKYIQNEMERLLLVDNNHTALTANTITHTLIDFAMKSTAQSREFVEKSSAITNGKLPPLDPTIHPGKFDHATCVSFRVGRVTLSYKDWIGS